MNPTTAKQQTGTPKARDATGPSVLSKRQGPSAIHGPPSYIDKCAELQRIFSPVHLEQGYIEAEQIPATVEDEAVTATEGIDKHAELQRIFSPE
jgi:hypothetical protein